MQACDRCHARKTRCDRRFPQCGACEKARVPCVHADKLRQRNLPRGYIDSLESQVQQLKAQNKSLEEDLARIQAGRDQIQSDSSTTNVAVSTSTTSHQTQAEGPPEDIPTSDAIAVEVGYLALVATGEIRYLGSSSGLDLANIINKVLHVQGGFDPLVPPSPYDDPSRSYAVKARIPLVPLESGIPPMAVAMTFIEAYFKHTHIAFPLLHRPTFLSTLEQIYGVPDYYDTHPFEAFVFDMVLAIGSSNLNRFDEVYAGSSAHFSRAQSKLTPITSLPGLESLKVILLLSQHGIFSNLRDTAASMWHLIGIGARICFEIGLHLEPKGSDSSFGTRTVSYDSEMRKRCFWCLYNLDRVVSFTLGRPFAIRDDEIDISLPSNLDDDCFGPDRNLEVGPQDGLSPFLHIIRIRRLSGEILRLFYNSKRELHAPVEDKLRMRRRFHDEIDAWKADTTRLCLVETSGGDEPVSCYLAAEWYNAVYNNAISLLYRPSPYLPHSVLNTSQSENGSDLLKLLSATKSSMESYIMLHRSRRLNYSWITFHGILVAGLAFVYTISSMIRDQSLHHALPDVLNLMDICRRCSNVLVAISERWNTTRQANDLFDRVSTAMIRDALALSRNKTVRRSSPEGSTLPNQQSDQEPFQDIPTEPSFNLALSTPITRLEDIIAVSDCTDTPAFFSGRREALIPSELLPVWPFEFPFGQNGGLDLAREDRDMAQWSMNM